MIVVSQVTADSTKLDSRLRGNDTVADDSSGNSGFHGQSFLEGLTMKRHDERKGSARNSRAKAGVFGSLPIFVLVLAFLLFGSASKNLLMAIGDGGHPSGTLGKNQTGGSGGIGSASANSTATLPVTLGGEKFNADALTQSLVDRIKKLSDGIRDLIREAAVLEATQQNLLNEQTRWVALCGDPSKGCDNAYKVVQDLEFRLKSCGVYTDNFGLAKEDPRVIPQSNCTEVPPDNNSGGGTQGGPTPLPSNLGNPPAAPGSGRLLRLFGQSTPTATATTGGSSGGFSQCGGGKAIDICIQVGNTNPPTGSAEGGGSPLSCSPYSSKVQVCESSGGGGIKLQCSGLPKSDHELCERIGIQIGVSATPTPTSGTGGGGGSSSSGSGGGSSSSGSASSAGSTISCELSALPPSPPVSTDAIKKACEAIVDFCSRPENAQNQACSNCSAYVTIKVQPPQVPGQALQTLLDQSTEGANINIGFLVGTLPTCNQSAITSVLSNVAFDPFAGFQHIDPAHDVVFLQGRKTTLFDQIKVDKGEPTALTCIQNYRDILNTNIAILQYNIASFQANSLIQLAFKKKQEVESCETALAKSCCPGFSIPTPFQEIKLLPDLPTTPQAQQPTTSGGGGSSTPTSTPSSTTTTAPASGSPGK